jgi:hypothetical protein
MPRPSPETVAAATAAVASAITSVATAIAVTSGFVWLHQHLFDAE